jgi:hypothetical protein
MNNNNMVELKCPFCEYEWNYTGKLIRASCPSCRRAVVVEKNKNEKKE